MTKPILSAYIEQALVRACVEPLEEGGYFASIPGFPGPWARGETEQSCLAEMRSVLEEWLVVALRADDELPELDGLSLNFGVSGGGSGQPPPANPQASQPRLLWASPGGAATLVFG